MVQIVMLLYAIQQNVIMGFLTLGKDEIHNSLLSVTEVNKNFIQMVLNNHLYNYQHNLIQHQTRHGTQHMSSPPNPLQKSWT